MESLNRLIVTLAEFPSKEWVNLYFDLLKKTLTDLSIENDDPRLGLSFNKDGSMPVNLGQRYILKPYTNGTIGIIVSLGFDEAIVGAETIFYFSTNDIQDAKFIQLPFSKDKPLPGIAYQSCLDESNLILDKTAKSGFRKFHNSLLHDFTMDNSIREEILTQVKFIR